MNNQDYWNERTQNRLNKQYKDMEKFEKELKRQYKLSIEEIIKEYNGVINKYAVDNQLTFQETQKLLNSYQLENYQKTITDLLNDVRINSNVYAKAELEKLRAVDKITIYDELLLGITKELVMLNTINHSKIEKKLIEEYEKNYFKTIYEIQLTVGRASEEFLNKEVVKNFVNQNWSGSTFSERIWKNNNNTIDKIKTEITQGLIRGSSNQNTIKRIMKQVNANYSNVERIVKTENAFIYSDSSFKAYDKYGLEKYIFMAKLDNRTSKICTELDGKVFNVKDRKVGVNCSPLHPHCRSGEAPYFEDISGLRAKMNRDNNTEEIKNGMKYEEWEKKYKKN